MHSDAHVYSGLVEIIEKMDLTKEVEHELRHGWHMEDVEATMHQRNVAVMNDKVERRFMDGMGQVTMSITPKYYHDMRALFGRDCWKDKAFRKSVMKKNPEVRVKSRADNTTLRVPGLKTGILMGSTHGRIVKKYA